MLPPCGTNRGVIEVKNPIVLVMGRLLVLLLVIAMLISACGETATTPTASPEPATDTTPAPSPTDQPAANLTEGCVENYDPTVDYFPEKISVDYAEGWTIDYFNHYKVVTVLNPWRDAETTFQYVLVQCGTPAPEGFADAQVIEVPINTIVTMSTTYLPHLTSLALTDALVAIDNFQFVNTPEIIALIEAEKLVEIGSGAAVDVERVIDLDPDVVMTYGVGNPQSDVHPVLLEAGLKVVLNSEYMEPSPLGRAEWLKFTAALFNYEAAAQTIFADIVAQYNELVVLAQRAEQQPTVFANTPFQGTWYMPGGRSYPARLLADAGTTYLWADDETLVSQQLSFEAVFDRAVNADFWVNTGTWTSRADALAEDERFAEFAAFQSGRIYNNNARVNEYGGNDYWESGVTNPHLVLADLIAIFHPDLLPEHELYFYRQLP